LRILPEERAKAAFGEERLENARACATEEVPEVHESWGPRRLLSESVKLPHQSALAPCIIQLGGKTPKLEAENCVPFISHSPTVPSESRQRMSLLLQRYTHLRAIDLVARLGWRCPLCDQRGRCPTHNPNEKRRLGAISTTEIRFQQKVTGLGARMGADYKYITKEDLESVLSEDFFDNLKYVECEPDTEVLAKLDELDAFDRFKRMWSDDRSSVPSLSALSVAVAIGPVVEITVTQLIAK
jgi:hypothetical protein